VNHPASGAAKGGHAAEPGLRVAVSGAGGRMGHMLIEAVLGSADCL